MVRRTEPTQSLEHLALQAMGGSGETQSGAPARPRQSRRVARGRQITPLVREPANQTGTGTVLNLRGIARHTGPERAVRLEVDSTSVLVVGVAQTGVLGYVVLYIGVAASWVGIPIIGAGVLAAAGALASEGDLNLWIVIVVATVAAWTGGYVGYLLGVRAGDVLSDRPGRWHRERRHAMIVGERIYRRWGRLAVFVTPTWVSGALRMPRNTFLVWNVFAAIVSTCIATLGAYGIGAAVLGKLSAKQGTIALVIAGVTLAAVALGVLRRRRSPPSGEQQ